MNLRHFFENMVRREETASAFLATLLEGHEAFRRAFLSELTRGLAPLPDATWRVDVEKDRVDVTLSSDDALILIENKIAAGAVQPGQLRGYYDDAVNRTDGRKRIIMVYLAPGNVGGEEVRRLETYERMGQRPGDAVRHVPWERVREIADGVASDQEQTEWFVTSSMAEIARAIETAKTAKFPSEPCRDRVRILVDDVLADLRLTAMGFTLGRWSARTNELIYTHGSPVTLWLSAEFKAQSEPPYAPVDVLQSDGSLKLKVVSQFKLAGEARNHPKIRAWWGELTKARRLEVPGVSGVYVLNPKGWCVSGEDSLDGADDAGIARRICEIGGRILELIRPALSL